MVDAARWRQVEEVFRRAADLDCTDRAAFIATARLADRMLESDLVHLLTTSDDVGGLIDSPVVRATLNWRGGASPRRAGATRPRGASPLEGRLVSHYEIEAPIGAGGMGVVYRARDRALGRRAALKVLPGTFTASLRQRLLDEAEMCSHLQHPAIATFYESGESEGIAFIAMELVEGETLRARLARGPLPVPEAMALAACLLEALGHAHAAAILHRDIKPENIMLTGPKSAKLLDFGIARHVLFDEAVTVAADALAPVLGTLGYMSPEQIRNDPQDARSDLFQVGAVLYEALTGRPAFRGRTAAEHVAAVLTRDPDPVIDPGVPAALSAVVLRALARDPARRYVSSGAFLSDLRKAGAGEWVADLPDAIAILDFDNVSGRADDAWIGSGIAEALAADLGGVAGLQIVSREKVAKVRTSGASAASIGLLLGCRWVLSGGYQRMGDALGVTARLVHAAADQVIATEKIDGTMAGLFEIQDRLAATVLDVLNLQRVSAGSQPARPSVSAFELYSRGRRVFLRYEKGSMERARELYEQAVAAEPGYAPALAGLAGFHAMRFTFTTDRRELDTAVEYARRAIDSEPTLADAQTWLGYALWRLGLHAEGYAAIQQAMTLAPSWFFPCYFALGIASSMGRLDDAVRHGQRAVEVAPRTSMALVGLAGAHMELGHYAEALWCFDRASESARVAGQTEHWVGLAGHRAECLRRMGSIDEARAACLAGLDEIERSDFMYRDSVRVVCLVTLGRTALQQVDIAAAHAAYHQALAHIRGRPRMLGGGQLLVQALAGASRAGDGAPAYNEAFALFERRDRGDFSWLPLCTDGATLLDLARAARNLGLTKEADSLRARAVAAGSLEARQAEWT